MACLQFHAGHGIAHTFEVAKRKPALGYRPSLIQQDNPDIAEGLELASALDDDSSLSRSCKACRISHLFEKNKALFT